MRCRPITRATRSPPGDCRACCRPVYKRDARIAPAATPRGPLQRSPRPCPGESWVLRPRAVGPPARRWWLRFGIRSSPVVEPSRSSAASFSVHRRPTREIGSHPNLRLSRAQSDAGCARRTFGAQLQSRSRRDRRVASRVAARGSRKSRTYDGAVHAAAGRSPLVPTRDYRELSESGLVAWLEARRFVHEPRGQTSPPSLRPSSLPSGTESNGSFTICRLGTGEVQAPEGRRSSSVLTAD